MYIILTMLSELDPQHMGLFELLSHSYNTTSDQQVQHFRTRSHCDVDPRLSPRACQIYRLRALHAHARSCARGLLGENRVVYIVCVLTCTVMTMAMILVALWLVPSSV